MKIKVALSASYALSGCKAIDDLLSTCDAIYTTQASRYKDFKEAFPHTEIRCLPFGTQRMFDLIRSHYEYDEVEWVDFPDLRNLAFPYEYRQPKPEQSNQSPGPSVDPIASKVEELENLLATACRCIEESLYTEWPTDLNRWWIKRQEEEEVKKEEATRKERDLERDHDLAAYYALKEKLGL